jgi:DNA-binding transcriptional LysR family regulator
MELKWLEDFTALANTLSFSRAAEERNVTQSAFSRRIKQLELWLGATLVSRASFPAELTKEGRAFLPTAEEAIRNFYHARTALQPPQILQHRTITFSALHTLTVTFFPEWLNGIRPALGDFRSRLSPDKGGIEENIYTLIDGEADFLLTYAHPSVPFLLDSMRFPYLVLGTEKVVPVSAPDLGPYALDHAISHQKPLAYLSYGDLSFFGVALSHLFARRPSFEQNVYHENTISIGLKAMALSGWGVAWLPESLIGAELDAGTLVRATTEPAWDLTVQIRLYRHGNLSRPLLNRFWQLCQSESR